MTASKPRLLPGKRIFELRFMAPLVHRHEGGCHLYDDYIKYFESRREFVAKNQEEAKQRAAEILENAKKVFEGRTYEARAIELVSIKRIM